MITDYSSLENEIKDVPEPVILPAGSEVKLRIITVKSGVSDKNGCTWYQPVFDVPSDPLVKEFNDFIWDLVEAKEKLDAKQYTNNLRHFRDFAEAMGLDYSRPFNWDDDLDGLTGWAILGVKKSDEYGDSNTIKKYIAGR